jgi:glycosyltransferase involved in cell wall biosynthesis
LLKDANIICVSSIDWAFNWQVPQDVASALGQNNRVFFIENTGVRALRWGDAGRIRRRLHNWLAMRGREKQVAAGVSVHSPLLVPLPYSRLARAINVRLLMRRIRAWLRRNPDAPVVILTFLPTPLVLELMREFEEALSVYYCVDHLSASSDAASKLLQHEREMFAAVNLVLVTSYGLMQNASEFTTRVRLLQAGVRAAEFARVRDLNRDTPAVFAHERRPFVGFVGSIRNETDVSLLTEVAALLPNVTFLLAGPLMTNIRQLQVRPNVRMLGALRHAEVIEYMLAFDVAIMPYVLNEFTAHIMPVKLKEYLAAGLPVVATRLPEVERFAEKHPGVVRFADDARTFADQLLAALDDRSPERVARRIEVARQYDWARQSALLQDLIERARAGRL